MLNINTKDIAMNVDYFNTMFNYSTNKGMSFLSSEPTLNPKETLAQNFGGSVGVADASVQAPISQPVANQVPNVSDSQIQFSGIPNVQNQIDPEANPVNLGMNVVDTPLVNNIPLPVVEPIAVVSEPMGTSTLPNISEPIMPNNTSEEKNKVDTNNQFASPFAVNNNESNIFDNNVTNLGIAQNEINNAQENGANNIFSTSIPTINPIEPTTVSKENDGLNNGVDNVTDNDAIKILMDTNADVAEMLAKTAKVILDNNEKIKIILENKNRDISNDTINPIPVENTASTIFNQTGDLNPQSLDQIPGFSMNKAA